MDQSHTKGIITKAKVFNIRAGQCCSWQFMPGERTHRLGKYSGYCAISRQDMALLSAQPQRSEQPLQRVPHLHPQPECLWQRVEE